MQSPAAGSAGTRWTPSAQHATVEQELELVASADRVGDRQAEALALLRHQFSRLAVRHARGVETDASATNFGIGASAQAQIEIDGLLDRRQRVTGKAQHMRPTRLMTNDDHVRLAAV